MRERKIEWRKDRTIEWRKERKIEWGKERKIDRGRFIVNEALNWLKGLKMRETENICEGEGQDIRVQFNKKRKLTDGLLFQS